ncbi:helix-turn-helix transcriptional regulator [Acetobacterium bakii]|uniref:XRE family transcriptional regulator n=1 Tax=Acetobacterium bakii TaxID=52689 RepID=A0A0L6U037_9FIRM|nr:helix-turn-helix transcriptional regulator [Acetobacterium bakii]KNZ41200.1 XRE family transcriptional regulator [Acetobacterium bakii]
MALENRLKEYRARKNLNQSDLGKLVGASRQTISLIERGDYSPSVVLALKIARVFDTTVESLFLYEEDKEELQ